MVAKLTDRDRQNTWEQAYTHFETPKQERRKFVRRLRRLGVNRWDRELRVVELFCGRGSALSAWEQLGFKSIEGVDLSAELVRKYSGKAQCCVADASRLPFLDQSRDVVCVQGGLHHLCLGEDLHQTLSEIHRVLSSSGRLVVVEPWQTPFLRLVHRMTDSGLVRRVSKRAAAFAAMVALERETYEAWLNSPAEVLEMLQRFVEVSTLRIGRGKMMLVGIRKDPPPAQSAGSRQ